MPEIPADDEVEASMAKKSGPYDVQTSPDEAAGPWRRLLMTLPAEDYSVRLARHATHVVLTAWRLAHVEDAAVLLVSELVTNAVRHASGTDAVGVDLHATRTWLRIEIQDTDRRWPRPRIPDGSDESGFGFVLVDALAAKWGVRETEAGKAVWAELDTAQGPAQRT
jgi:anti-sigma regulatory factor (Ser/Thr protein kinase)